LGVFNLEIVSSEHIVYSILHYGQLIHLRLEEHPLA